MHYIGFLAYIFLISITQPAFAQEAGQNEISYENEYVDHEKSESKDGMFTLSIENDSIGGGTDSNYTSGVRLTYMDINADIPNIVKEVFSLVPTIDINEASSVYYSFGQNLYSPDDIKKRTLSPNDRPYAGWLYGSVGLTTITGNHLDEGELSIGMIGPASLGQVTQKFVHKYLSNSPKPRGWNSQLKNEPGIILSWQRSWPIYNKIETPGGYVLHSTPHIGATLGNIYTYANAGMTFNFVPKRQDLQLNPQRVRPSIPGTGYYDIPKDKWGWNLFAGFEGRAIARNIFLDGNTFTDSRSVDKNYFVGDVSAGAALTYNDVRLSYTLTYRSEEYENQQDSQIFGSISLSKRF